MTKSGKATLAAGLMLGLVVSLPVSGARIVCWTNADGVRECGNAVPPEYAQQSTERKSKQGITVERKARAKTSEELAAERAQRERMSREEEERQRIEAERAQYDRVLLATFTTEEDLKLTRDGKIAAIESRIKHSQQVGRKLKENLAALQAEAARLERGGKAVSADLEQQIADVRTQIDKNVEEVALREREKVRVSKQFSLDLARYRELKGIN